MRNNILRKGQIQLMESTLVLFVFFLIVIVGMAVYTNIQAGRFNRLALEVNDQQAEINARKILTMPELECSNQNDIQRDCFEIQKLKGFQETVNLNGRYYREELGDVKVIVNWIYSPSMGNYGYPEFFKENDLFVDEKVLIDFSSDLKSKRSFYFPVILKDERFSEDNTVPSKNYLGWTIIEVYS